MNLLDVCSGIGGFSLGLEAAGFKTVAFCEFDEKCRQVLKKHWPTVPQYYDLRELTAERLKQDGITDIRSICGGYPCQPFSLAGKREGTNDDRHLWPEIARLLKEFANDERPIEWCIFENVYGHITMGLDSVLADLEALGYTWWATVVPACAVGAFHRRDRVWIVAHYDELTDGQQYIDAEERDHGKEALSSLAHTTGKRCGETRKSGTRRQERVARSDSAPINVAHSSSERLQGRQKSEKASGSRKKRHEFASGRDERSKPGSWAAEPPVGRVANGIQGRAHRLKQLGNAVVPQVVEMIGISIMEADRSMKQRMEDEANQPV